VIVNPVAGRGKTRHDLSAIRSAFTSVGVEDFRTTQASGDEEVLARNAIASGADKIIAVGGDGTCNRIASAILSAGKSCRLGVVPTGTGNDFAKTLGVAGRRPEEIAALVKRSEGRRMDVGRVDGRFLINSCGFGFDASVLAATKRVRVLTGDGVYIYSALRQLFTYRAMQVAVDSNSALDSRPLLMLTVSNGRYLGGAFCIAPGASVVDGELDVGFFGDANLIGRVRIFAGAFRGTHVKLPSVVTRRVHEITLLFPAPPMMELDGELRQASSATVKIECVSRGLNVIAAPGYPR
jgi:diacylglycerol kinase (ATP)